MTFWTLIKRSAGFYLRSHLGVVLGAAVGGTVLVGALLVGDSMRASLLRKSLEAIGPFDYALSAGDRFFTAELANRMLNSPLADIAAVLMLPGVVTSDGGEARANNTMIIGAGPEFLQLMTGGKAAALGEDSALLNPALADQLGVEPGDEILIRMPKPGALSREVTLTEREDTDTTLRLEVAGVLPPSAGGDFSLRRSQASPLNVFVKRERLAQATELEGKANVLLATEQPEKEQVEGIQQLSTALRQSWRIEDAMLELRYLTNTGALELRTPRVFLDPPVAAAAQEAPAGTNAQPVLTYLANLLQSGTNYTPYSFVTAAGPPFTPPDMRKDEIIVSQWVAEDLQVKPGDKLTMVYFLPESGADLKEATNHFTVRSIVPDELPWADRSLMPDFPGIEKAESTGDWEVGFELVYDIRQKDEDYWTNKRGTPKAFVTLAAGQGMWANRFGDLTALRWPARETNQQTRAALAADLLDELEPEQVGLRFEPIREEAKRAASQSQDFGQLFLGFSMFLLFAALLLVSLLFQFGLEQRAAQVGTLLAVGFTPRQTKRLLLAEGALLALLGSVLGALGGIAYAKVMLWGLRTLWRDAVGTSGLYFAAHWTTLAIGVAATLLVATLTIWLTLRKLTRQPALDLLAQSGIGHDLYAGKKTPRPKRALWLGLVTGLCAGALVAWSMAKGGSLSAGVFFGAGALLLTAGLAGVAAWLRTLAYGPGRDVSPKRPLTMGSLGIRGSSRRGKRSLATVALLSCGVFLISSISVFRLDAGREATQRSSGTGGFALVGEATMPVVQDLNTRSGQEFFGLSPDDFRNVQVVSMRVRPGDDASCLNLNRAQKPRVLGVDPGAMEGRFTFTGMMEGIDREAGWRALRRSADLPADEVPAIGDANSIQWALGAKVGETIDYTDEFGRSFKLRLVGAVANSVLQGSLLIDENEFRRRFPSESGYRAFLVDVPPASVEEVQNKLTRALQDAGLELTSAVRRLNAFNAVQNTYLGAFQVLGGLGLLLGSVGLGIVVLRNVLERRGELGLLSAVGFSRRSLQRLLIAEHGALLGLGLGIGLVAGFVAVLPALITPGTELPLGSVSIMLAAVLLNGLLWTWGATRFALRGDLVSTLRNE